MMQDNAALKRFFDALENYRQWLTRQEIKTLRGQALAGDLEGAKRGLLKLVARGL